MARRWIAIAVLLLARSARADDVIPGHHIDSSVAGGVTAGAIAVGALAKLVPVRSEEPWEKELSESDLSLRGRLDQRAGHIADGLLAVSIAAPAVYLTGTTVEDSDGDRLVIYAQTLAIDMAIASLAKHLVQRPRPYTYSKDPLVRRYARRQGDDAFMSFYSGHTAVAFGAATAGAYLLGASGEGPAVRTTAWGVGFAIAGMTGALRVRSGNHFYSDVFIGGLVGTTIGFVVPAVHADSKPYLPSGTDVLVASGAVIAGALIGTKIPLGSRRAPEDSERGAPWQLTPTVTERGAGLGVVGIW